MGLRDALRRFLGGGALEPDEREPAPRSRRDAIAREREAAKPPQRRQRVTGIDRSALSLIREMAKSAYPNEFGATLRAENRIVTEIILVPGTLGGDRHAILPLGYLPVDPSIVGTVHSHPGVYAIPSDADKQLFRAFGHTHIIIAEPYDEASWIAYDQDARIIDLEILD